MCSHRVSIGGYFELIRAEFRESPGLRLTQGEIERLWRLDPVTGSAVVGALVEACVLRRTPSGAYVRADGGDEVPIEPAPSRRPRPLSRE